MTARLTAAQARGLRLRCLLLGGAPSSDRPPPGVGGAGDVAGVVTWFGAMQAQDLGSGLWSLGVRLPHLDQADVEAALERREALRTWPMRGTLHLVPSRDAHWMLDLTGRRALAGAAKRREQLGLPQEVADRAVDVLGTALAGGGRLTRSQCVATLEDAGIGGAGQRAYHLLWYASQRGVTCIAPNVAGEQTFVLLDEWVPDPVRLDRDEALATIARRYLRSHGPTTAQDLAGWTGLTMADTRRALAALGATVATVTVDGREALLDTNVLDTTLLDAAVLDAASLGEPTAADVVVLPGFDEFLLGFKDRSLVLADEHEQAVIPGKNGMFQATVVRAGRVVGTWRRTARSQRTLIDVRPLVRLTAPDRRRVEAALARYGSFTRRPIEVRWP